MWINHINDETRMTEELNSVLPVRKKPASLATNNDKTGSTSTSATSTTRTTETVTTSVPATIGSQLVKLKDSITSLPNQLLSAGGTTTTRSEEIVSTSLALQSQPLSALPATTREQAAQVARVSAGKADPLSPIIGFKKFPTSGERKIDRPIGKEKGKNGLIPPPPMDAIPPPPPPILPGQTVQGDILPLNELPSPPERPSIARHLKLIGVLGDRAFLSTDSYVRQSNRLPKVLSLSPGDRVDYVSVLAVTDNSVTLEEDGQKLVKRLSALR